MNSSDSSGYTAAFLGDVRAPERFPGEPANDPVRVINPFDGVATWLHAADLIVANLEGPIGDEGGPRPGRAAILHNAERVVTWFRPFRRTAFCLANNHIMDRGLAGLRNTLARLDRAGISHFGAGLTEADAMRPLMVTANGFSAGFLAFSTDQKHVGSVCAAGEDSGAANLFSPAAMPAIAELARRVSHACVVLHWGHEFLQYPEPEQLAAVRQIASLGVKSIICHHPHVIQGMGRMGDTQVAYSLGNCVFPEFRQTNGRFRTQSDQERRFLFVRSRLDAQSRPPFETLQGKCRRDGRLEVFAGRQAQRAESYLAELSAPLTRADYPAFYANYVKRQHRRLERQQAFRSFRKAFQIDPRTITLTDVKRTWARLFR